MARQIRVCLDPGHGKDYNRGAYTKYYEGTKMFELAGYLKTELESRGFWVMNTRSSVSDCPSLAERAKMAINNKCDVLLSLHSNGSSSESVNTMSVYASVKTQANDQLAVLLSEACYNLFAKDIPVKNANAYHKYNSSKTDYYGVLRNSVVSGSPVVASFIIEHGFHSNKKMAEWLYNSENLKKLAKAEADVMASYFAETGGFYATFDTDYTQYIVVSGDSWSKIAKNKLGDSTRYPEIQKYNSIGSAYTLQVNDGVRIPKHKVDVNDDTIISGKKVTVVATTPDPDPETPTEPTDPTEPETPSTGYTTYTVKSGDSWWSIAAKQMGNGAKYKELAAFNGTTTSKVIHPGDVLKIPGEGSDPGYVEYTVQKGDSFWSIAAKQMGSGSKYKELAAYNCMSTSTVIHPGDVLKVPK